MDLALNNLQRLICHKIQPTNQPTNLSIYLCVCVYVGVNKRKINSLTKVFVYLLNCD